MFKGQKWIICLSFLLLTHAQIEVDLGGHHIIMSKPRELMLGHMHRRGALKMFSINCHKKVRLSKVGPLKSRSLDTKRAGSESIGCVGY